MSGYHRDRTGERERVTAKLVSQGLTQQIIAQRLGVTKSCVANIVRRLKRNAAQKGNQQ